MYEEDEDDEDDEDLYTYQVRTSYDALLRVRDKVQYAVTSLNKSIRESPSVLTEAYVEPSLPDKLEYILTSLNESIRQHPLHVEPTMFINKELQAEYEVRTGLAEIRELDELYKRSDDRS